MERKGSLARHPLVFYFTLAFVISWTGALLTVAPKLLHHEDLTRKNGLFMFPVMLLGPLLAGLFMIRLQDKKNGWRELRLRMLKWRMPFGWQLLSYLIPPVFILVILFFLSHFVSIVFQPNLLPRGILSGIFAGFIEEIGWTGYAYPSMRKIMSARNSALLLGLLWGLWHLPVIDFLGAAFPHREYLGFFILAFIGLMMGIRILIIWVYSKSGSLIYAQAMHAISTGCLVMLGPAAVTAQQETIWYALYAFLVWIFVLFNYRLLKQSF
jgi:uncharacterized protein